MIQELEGFQRKALRGLAHNLDPAVLVGQAGLSPAVLASINAALEAHELIKVKFVDRKEEKRELTATISQECAAHIAGMVGHVAILYREHSEPEKRRVRLPQRDASEE